MNYTVTIKSQDSKEAALAINEELAEDLKLTKKKRGFVSFGTGKIYVDIQITRDSDKEEIYLSESVIKELHLPSYPILEVKTKGNEIMLGPCIGILASHKYEDITKRRLKEMAQDLMGYSRIHGAIIVFSLDKVDRAQLLVEGYCYNPKEDSWEKGTFPYPLAIYRRSPMNDKWRNHFLSVIGDAVFSNGSFDKWDMHQWFSVEPGIAGYLPETKPYYSKEDFVSMLEEHGVIYVKPAKGMKGFGVVRACKEGEKISFDYREDDENKNIVTTNDNELVEALERLFESGNHIIQQGLELINYDEGIVDFRCVMQKNEVSKWVCNGIIARIGAKESVVSNISSGGAALPGLELMNEALDLPRIEIYILKEKMISLCTKVCNALDEYGFNFGTLGLDIGIDKNYNIWLIEVNNRKPHPAIALRANDIPAYYTILNGPLHYAKALAGFGSKEGQDDVL
jgi:glutathione synthase/RimK-type ligase-like ATP-grasp enzyme